MTTLLFLGRLLKAAAALVLVALLLLAAVASLGLGVLGIAVSLERGHAGSAALYFFAVPLGFAFLLASFRIALELAL